MVGCVLSVDEVSYLCRKSPSGIMPEKERTSNDQRSDVHNPTSSEHKAANDNRSTQMNPNSPAYHSSRGKK